MPGVARAFTEHPVAGKAITIKDPNPADPTKRSIVYIFKNTLGPAVVGDPRVMGATLEIVNDSEAGQCILLPASGWRVSGSTGFKFKGAAGSGVPVASAAIKASASGVFLNKVVLKGKFAPIATLLPTNSVEVHFTINNSGDDYCGDFGGFIKNNNNTARIFKATGAPAPASCAPPCSL
jgi:hypothetical protein